MRELEAELGVFGPLVEQIAEPPLETLRGDIDMILRCLAEGLPISVETAAAIGVGCDVLLANAKLVVMFGFSPVEKRGRGQPPHRDSDAYLRGYALHTKRGGAKLRGPFAMRLYAAATGAGTSEKQRKYWGRKVETFDSTEIDALVDSGAIAPIVHEIPRRR